MLSRLVLGAVTAGSMVVPALAGMMNADEARRFVTGKVFAFNCFDGTRGAGRVLDDLGAAGSIQFSGSGPIRHVRLPGNTLQIRGQAVCAPSRAFRSSRASISTSAMSARPRLGAGMGFAYCDFLTRARADADGPFGGAAALAARPSRGARPMPRAEFGPRRDAGGRERQARAVKSE